MAVPRRRWVLPAPGLGTPGLGTPGLGTPGWLGTPGLGTPGLGTPGLGTLRAGQTPGLGKLWLGKLWLGTPGLGTLWLGKLWLGSLLSLSGPGLSVLRLHTPRPWPPWPRPRAPGFVGRHVPTPCTAAPVEHTVLGLPTRGVPRSRAPKLTRANCTWHRYMFA